MIGRLCYIADGNRATAGRPLEPVVRELAAGGVEMVIVRQFDWSASRWRELAEALAPLRRRGLRVLASRRLDLARALGLDGVHLAADAVDVTRARAWLGDGALVGYSAHSGDEARRAAGEGADYVTLSPIYPTSSKPGEPGRGCAWLAEATRDLDIPALALGGVTPARTAEVLAAGAWGVAAVTALGAVEDPARAAGEFAGELGRAER